ncbi:MAG: protein kinase, partial [Planctomycetaceae bacterium]
DAPKITDFGLAKLTDQNHGMTVTGAIVGTPSYMSPEQATGNTETVGPSSDVYGLGAILYACLCGHPPFRGPSTMATVRMVLNDRPTPLRQLRSDIPIDLETICLKCLEKDPKSRYESARALSDELQRFIDGRPIIARPVSTSKRLVSWCRRNPAIAGSLLAIVTTLVIAAGVSSYFAVEAYDRAAEAEAGKVAARKQSRIALNVAQSVVRNVQEKLKQIPEARETRKELLRDVITELQTISRTYIDGGEVDLESAQALHDLAVLYTELGDDAGGGIEKVAGDLFRRSSDIYLQLLQQDATNVAYLDPALRTFLNYGDTAREYKWMDQAIWAHTQARRVASEWHEREPENPVARLDYIKSCESVGEALLVNRQFDESQAYIEEAVALARQFIVDDQSVIAYENLSRCLCTLGDMHRRMGQLDESEIAYLDMVKATDKAMELEPDNPDHLDSKSCDYERLGDLEMRRKNHEKALEHYEKMLGYSEAYIADDPTNLFRQKQATWAYDKLAGCCQKLGKKERAKWARQKVAEIRRRIKGKK